MTIRNAVLSLEESNGKRYRLGAARPPGEHQRLQVGAERTVATGVAAKLLDRAVRGVVHGLPGVQDEVAKNTEEGARREAKRLAALREAELRLRARRELQRLKAEAALREALWIAIVGWCR